MTYTKTILYKTCIYVLMASKGLIVKIKKYDELEVTIYDSREEMGRSSAKEAIDYLCKLLETKEEVNCVFAAAPSQNEFLEALCVDKNVDWSRVNAFHMDEYVGFEIGSPASFSGFLKKAIFDRLPFKTINLLNGMSNPQEEELRYAKLLSEFPIDIVFMGIGENGHIAFNDPSVADFKDAKMVKVVELEESCRQQQVNDGCFPTMADVPTHALTLTIPALIGPKQLFCIVPNERKAQAVAGTLLGEIDEVCPASILRTKKDAKLYLDLDSASKLGL